MGTGKDRLGRAVEECQGETWTGWERSGKAVMCRYVAARMATAGIGPEWQSGKGSHGMASRGLVRTGSEGQFRKGASR